MRFPVVPKTKAELNALANPSSANQPEALPWVLYDTQTYVSGTTTTLTFFQQTNADPTITNMQTGGQLVDPNYFRVYYAYLDVLSRPSINSDVGPATATGLLDDIAQLMLTGRGIWTLNLQDKQTGPFPLSVLHSTGYANGLATMAQSGAAAAAEDRFESGQAGDPRTTFCFDGSVVIKPKVGWNMKLQWSGALALTGDTPLRVSLAGVWYRAVL